MTIRTTPVLGADTPASLGANYIKLWSASAISNLGDGVRMAALPLLAATLSREPAKVAAIDLAQSLPWLLFALIAGALVDRLNRRTVMVYANVFRAAVMATLALVVFTDIANFPLLYALAFLLGSAETMFDNSAQAIMPSLVPRSLLETANGRMFAAEMVANQFAGPPLGSFLFVAAAGAPFVVDSISFAVAAVLIFLIAGSFATTPPPAGRVPLHRDIGEGLRWLWQHRLLRTLAIMLGTWNMLTTAWFSIFVLFALQILDLSKGGFGILLATMAAGSIAGGLVGPWVNRVLGPGTTLIATVFVGAAAPLVIALTSSPVVAGMMLVLEGLVIIVWNVITVSLRQAIIPDRLLGRVNSVYRLVGWGTLPVGAALGGFLGSVFGLRAPLFVNVAVLAIMGVAAIPIVNNAAITAARAAAADASEE
jgi:MFS family permease